MMRVNRKEQTLTIFFLKERCKLVKTRGKGHSIWKSNRTGKEQHNILVR